MNGKKMTASVMIFLFTIFSLFQGNGLAFDAANATVVEGNVTIDSTDPNNINITNNAASSIIDVAGGGFDISNGQTINVNQLMGSQLLIRDISGNITEIAGTLNVLMGLLVLVNTYGIHVDSTGVINISAGADLIASTLNIQNQLFTSGNLTFEQLNGTDFAEIINDGQITAEGMARIALLSDAIENHGTIEVASGEVMLAGVERATVDLSGSGLINLVVNQGVTDNQGQPVIVNDGELHAESGKITMTAEMLNNTLDTLINSTGIVEAGTAAIGEEGTVEIRANGAVDITSVLEAMDVTVEALGNSQIGSVAVKNLILAGYEDGVVAYDVKPASQMNLSGDMDIEQNTTINAHDAQIEVKGNWTSEGTFNGQNSTVTFNGGGVADASVPGGVRAPDIKTSTTDRFNEVIFNKNSNSGVAIDSTDTLVVEGNLSLLNGFVNGGTIEAYGNVIHSSDFDGGSADLHMTGSNVRNLELAAGKFTGLTLDSANVTVLAPGASGNPNAAGTIEFGNDLKIIDGIFDGGVSGNVSTTTNVIVRGDYVQEGGEFIAPGGNFQVNGDFIHTHGGIFNHNNGTFVYKGAGSRFDVNGTEEFNHLIWDAGQGSVFAGAIFEAELVDPNGDGSFDTLFDTLVVRGDLTLRSGTMNNRFPTYSITDPTATIQTYGNVNHEANFRGGDVLVEVVGNQNRDINILAGGTGSAQPGAAYFSSLKINVDSGTQVNVNLPGSTANTCATGACATFFGPHLTVSGNQTHFNGGTGNIRLASYSAVGGGRLTVNDGAIFDAPTGTFGTAGSIFIDNATFNHNGGTISMDTIGAAPRYFHLDGSMILNSAGTFAASQPPTDGTPYIFRTATPPTFDVDGSLDLHNLVINKAGGGVQIGNGDKIYIEETGTLSLLQGQLNTQGGFNNGTGTIEVYGNVIHGDKFGVNNSGGTGIVHITDRDPNNPIARDVYLAPSAFPQLFLDSEAVTVHAPGASGNLSYAAPGKVYISSIRLDAGTFDGGPAGTDIDVTRSVTINGGTFLAPDGDLIIGRNFTHLNPSNDPLNPSIFDARNGTVIFNGPGANGGDFINLGPDGEDFNHLVINKFGGNSQLAIANNAEVRVHGDFHVMNGRLMGGTVFAEGNVTLDGPGVDAVQNPGLISGSTTHLTFTGNGDQSYTENNTRGLEGTYLVDKTSGTVTLETKLNLTRAGQDLIVRSGTLDMQDKAVTVADQIRAEQTGTIRLDGSQIVTSASKTFIDESTVIYEGDGTSSLVLGNTYANLQFLGTGVNPWMHNGTLDINGDLLIGSNNTLNSNNRDIFIEGNWTNQGSYTSGGNNTVTFDGTESINLNPGANNDFDNITVLKGANGEVDLVNNNLNMTGVLTVADGTLNQNASAITNAGIVVNGGDFNGGTADIDVNGNVDILNGNLKATSTAMHVAGNWNNQDTFDHNHGHVILDGATNANLNNGSDTFNRLTISKTNTANTVDLQNNLEVEAVMTVQEGTFNQDANDIVVGPAGDNANAGRETFNMNGGVFNGSDTGAVMDINGDYRQTGGDFTATNGEMQVSGDFRRADGGTTTIANPYYNPADPNSPIDLTITTSAGTFNHNQGTVVLDAKAPGANTNQTVTGSTQFNHLKKQANSPDTITFESGSLTEVVGDVTLRGSAGTPNGRLYIRSTNAGQEAYLAMLGNRDITMVDVQDNHNLTQPVVFPTDADVLAHSAVDSGDTTNWFPESEEPTNPGCTENCETIDPRIDQELVDDTTPEETMMVCESVMNYQKETDIEEAKVYMVHPDGTLELLAKDKNEVEALKQKTSPDQEPKIMSVEPDKLIRCVQVNEQQQITSESNLEA